jgi:hypothetical protein
MDLKQQILLSYIGQGGEIDPIRIMKGLFVFSKETPAGWIGESDRYHFVPYQFGPCSFDIYSDLDALERSGYLQSKQPLGQSWKYYSVTDMGKYAVEQAAGRFQPQVLTYLNQVRSWVDQQSFKGLLKAIYRRYPAYASNSVFKF